MQLTVSQTDKYEVYRPVFPDFENKNAIIIAADLTYEQALQLKERHPEYIIYPQRFISN